MISGFITSTSSMALHYLDGQWVKDEDLKISAFDLSVVRGFGVFDFLRTYRKKPFLLDEHLQRFYNSAKLLGLVIPVRVEALKKIIDEGIKKNADEELNIRMVLTGGVGVDSLSLGKPSLIIMFTKAVPYPNELYQNGVKVITFVASRFLARAKSLNYLAAISALQEAKQKNAVEAIYIDEEKNIFEGTTTNFFAVIGGSLITSEEGILKGITRKAILDLVEELGIPLEIREMNMREMHAFSEAFITASNKEVMPVVQIDDTKVGDGKVGKITQKIMDAYRKLTESY